MAKWNCPCGYPMHDHNAPDENFYRVFSDVEWNAIETDDNGNLNFCKDIPVQTYDVYKCPSCGRLMVFDGGDTFKTYVPELWLIKEK